MVQGLRLLQGALQVALQTILVLMKLLHYRLLLGLGELGNSLSCFTVGATGRSAVTVTVKLGFLTIIFNYFFVALSDADLLNLGERPSLALGTLGIRGPPSRSCSGDTLLLILLPLELWLHDRLDGNIDTLFYPRRQLPRSCVRRSILPRGQMLLLILNSRF